MINPIKLLKLYNLANEGEGVVKENSSMTVKVPQLLTLFATLATTIGLPTLVTGFVHAHLFVYMGVVAAAVVLHALMPSVFAAPSAADLNATGLGTTTKVGLLLLVFFLAPTLCAQTATPAPTPAPTQASNGFSSSSDAVALFYQGEWTAGTHITESLDFLDFGATKANHVYLEGHELLAPGPGLSFYLGGIGVQPDLTALLKKTNVPGAFTVEINAALGDGLPTTGGSHVTFIAGGKVSYQLTSALQWQSLQAHYGRFGTTGFASLSTGLAYYFGK